MTHILALSGSLRADSFNTRLLRALPPLAPSGMELEIYDGIGDLPLYNEELDTEHPPPAVQRLREAIAAADGLVIATPEYLQSVPGVLKNAIDWASRPHGRGALTGKGIAVMVATLGRSRGFRGLTDTTRILNHMGNFVVPDPEVVVSSAPSALEDQPDGTVKLTDEAAGILITVQLEALADIVKTQAAAGAREAVERNRPLLHFLQFFPYITRALDEGGTVAAVTERLTAAGIDADTSAEWIARAQRTR